MTLRPQAPGFTKPLASLPFLPLNLASLADSRPDGRDVMTNERPQCLPDGRVCDKFQGRPTAGGLKTEMPLATGAAQPGDTSSEASGAESSTLDSQMRQIGMFVHLLTILSAVTLLWLRHHRRDHTSPRRIGRRI